MDLYFECNSGISGDMAVASLLDLGASQEKLDIALKSINLADEFDYEIKNVLINSIKALDFNVVLKSHHSHTHRNLSDIYKILESAKITDNALKIAKEIFKIVAQAEAHVHDKDISEIHFHEIGAVDSIVDILSFAVLLDDLNPEKTYISTLTEGQGTVECQHGTLNVPVPAVCKIVSEYKLPIKFSDTQGEMVTPTGAAISAYLYKYGKLDKEFTIEKIGYGAGKRKYINPVLRVMQIK